MGDNRFLRIAVDRPKCYPEGMWSSVGRSWWVRLTSVMPFGAVGAEQTAASLGFAEFRVHRRWAPAAGLTVIASAALACTPLDPEDDTFDDIQMTGMPQAPPGSQAPDWSCVGEPAPPPPANPPPTVRYSFPMVDWVYRNPFPGRTIKVCNRIDTPCANPVPAATEIDDNERVVSVDVPTGLPVYLILAGPDVVPTLLYFDGPLYSDQTGGMIQFLTVPVITGLATGAQINLDPTLGVIAVRPHDCNGNIAEGAVYEIADPAAKSIPYTFVNGLVRTAQRPPVPGVVTPFPSDYSPWAGFTNVTPSSLTVTGKLFEDNREFGTADISVLGGYMHAVEVRAANHL